MSLDVDLMIGNKSYFEFNITHNLCEMASAAGLYQAMWRPEELFGNDKINAKSLIPYLEIGIECLEDTNRFEEFKALEPDNGWGDYDGLLKAVKSYLRACKDLPNATVLTDT